MSSGRLLLVLFFLLANGSAQHFMTKSRCTEQALKRKEVCVSESKQFDRYCDAQAFCAARRSELLTGAQLNEVMLASADMTAKWIGITDLLHERQNYTHGWRFTDGSEVHDPLYRWGSIDSREADCVHLKGNIFFTRSCSKGDKIQAICQGRGEAERSKSASFQRVPIWDFDEKHLFAEESCLQKVKAKSAIQCAALCAQNEPDWCASFYFHPKKESCHLVRYTDTAVNTMSENKGWLKFKLQS